LGIKIGLDKDLYYVYTESMNKLFRLLELCIIVVIVSYLVKAERKAAFLEGREIERQQYLMPVEQCMDEQGAFYGKDFDSVNRHGKSNK